MTSDKLKNTTKGKKKSYKKIIGTGCHFHKDTQGDGKHILDIPEMQPLCSSGQQ